MAGHGGFHRAQRLRALELAEQQRNELIAAGEAAHQLIAASFLYKPLEDLPVDQLEKILKHAILMPHGVGPFRSG